MFSVYSLEGMMKSIEKIFSNTSQLTFIIKYILFLSGAFPELCLTNSESPDSKVKGASCVQSTLMENTGGEKKRGRNVEM